MSFLAKMVLGSSEFTILNLDYEIYQPVDQQNRPNGFPRGGLVNLVVETDNRSDLVEWMLKETMQKNGSIVFSRRDANASLKTISFKDAFCVRYREVYESLGQAPMKIYLTLSARELTISSHTLVNKWPGSDGKQDKQGTQQSQQEDTQSSTISSFIPS